METRQSNVAVWEDTYKQCESGYFKNAVIKPSVKYSFTDLQPINPITITNEPILEIINEDTFTTAQRLVKEGYNPLVLNMANASVSGGGFRKGASAQEENLFRRSNYYKFLNQKVYYPIQSDEVIYSPNVLVFKDKYYNITNPYTVACIACAAIRNPTIIAKTETVISYFKPPQITENSDYAKETDRELTLEKIDAIFRVALLNGHDSLVLGALGCGAFRNPSEKVAELFNICLKKWKNSFKYFCFAVKSTRDPNYLIFREKISF